MPSDDRPYFESQRERERSNRDREFPSSRRGFRRDDDDDRGPWISRDRDEFERGGSRDFRRDPNEGRGRRESFESDFDRREHGEHEFGRERRRFEPFEDRSAGDLERFKKFIEERGVETGAYRGAIPSPDQR
jgi:hypothetical protein